MADLDLQLIIDMWNSGKSSKDIANHFGVTKNVIIGKVYRARQQGLNVKIKGNPIVPKPKPYMKPKLKLVQGDTVLKEGLAIYDLGPGQCKYSTGESVSGEYLFCGKAHTNHAYCNEHHALCHKKPEKKESIPRRDYKNKFLRIY
jgi:hypothetical protein